MLRDVDEGQTDKTTLDPLTVRHLVTLRLMLEAALSQARSAGRYGRGPAVVAQDGVIERAVYLVGVRENLLVKTHSSIDDLHSQLKAVDSLKKTWNTQQSAVVIRRLHRIRNNAQHEGIDPGREEMPMLISATEAYVVSLIRAAYEVDLRRILLADAISDTPRSALVEAAQHALLER